MKPRSVRREALGGRNNRIFDASRAASAVRVVDGSRDDAVGPAPRARGRNRGMRKPGARRRAERLDSPERRATNTRQSPLSMQRRNARSRDSRERPAMKSALAELPQPGLKAV